jgi:hypothetical protein
MAISPEYLGLLLASINSSPEWKQAWERTNDYLDALRVPAIKERFSGKSSKIDLHVKPG